MPTVSSTISTAHTSWPSNRRGTATLAPCVHNYCLSSPVTAFCDFHADFGGSSVYYHVHTGSKTFYILPPNNEVIAAYEHWLVMPNQSNVFFPDLVKEEYLSQVTVEAGETLFIPSGYIHAVYTNMDSLVFGGNFLTGYNIAMQVRERGRKGGRQGGVCRLSRWRTHPSSPLFSSSPNKPSPFPPFLS